MILKVNKELKQKDFKNEKELQKYHLEYLCARLGKRKNKEKIKELTHKTNVLEDNEEFIC